MTDDVPDGSAETEFPALIRPLLDADAYTVRETLFDVAWVSEVTDIDYSAFESATQDRD